MAKLAIMEEREEDKYEHVTVLKCWGCDPENGKELPDVSSSERVCFSYLMHEVSTNRHTRQRNWLLAFCNPCLHLVNRK